jgi:hypothetical protein
MPAQQPGIVQGEHHGHIVAQSGKVPQIEVPPVKVMRMDDLWSIRWTLQQVRRSGEVKVLNPMTQVEPALQFANGCQPTRTPGDAWIPRIVQRRLHTTPHPDPRRSVPLVRNPHNLWVIGIFGADRKPGVVAAFPICLKEVPRHLLGATAGVGGVDLKDA